MLNKKIEQELIKMKNNIKMVAVDIDGTFVRPDYTYDVLRFKRILLLFMI